MSPPKYRRRARFCYGISRGGTHQGREPDRPGGLERKLSLYRRFLARLPLAATFAAALALSACGRAGPLEPPPGPAFGSSTPAATSPTASSPIGGPNVAANQNAAKDGFDAQGNPVAAPGEKKPFLLDFLLR